MTIKRFFLVILVGLFAACGFVPIQKEMLRTGETLAVDIEGYAFYEKLIITELGDGKTNFEVDRSSPLRNDKFSQEVGKVFEEKFPAELRARGVIVASGAPLKMKIHLAHGTSEKSPGLIALMAVVSFSKQDGSFNFEVNVLSAFPSLAKKESIPFGEWRDLKTTKVLAERLSEASANAVVIKLREKGEIRSEGR